MVGISEDSVVSYCFECQDLHHQNKYRIAQNFGGIGTASKLAEKTLAVGRCKAHSILELMRPHNFWQIKLWLIGNELPDLPKFSPTKVLCYMVTNLTFIGHKNYL